MKLYFTTYIDDAAEPDDMHKVKWYATQADQKKDAKVLKSDGMRNIEPSAIDVPTDKPGLLSWLNERGVRT
jgi:hypothetical protein